MMNTLKNTEMLNTLKNTNIHSERGNNNKSRNQGTGVKTDVDVTSSNDDSCSKGQSSRDDNQKNYIRV